MARQTFQCSLQFAGDSNRSAPDLAPPILCIRSQVLCGTVTVINCRDGFRVYNTKCVAYAGLAGFRNYSTVRAVYFRHIIKLARGLRRQTQLLQKCARKAKKTKIANPATQKCTWENSCKLEKYSAQMPLEPLGENAAIFPDAFLRGKPINSCLSGIEGLDPG